MGNQKYFIGLDIGTDSVGYAVTDERYNLCKFKGEPMWGVSLFDEGRPASDRRGHRVARRRLDRRQQRVRLLSELFAAEISKGDPMFFSRIKESYLYPESEDAKIRIFSSYRAQRDYAEKYPTIHHLIVDLMNSAEPHDIRLVYIACAWLVAHRGHFLNEVDKKNIEKVLDFNSVYSGLTDFLTRDGLPLPWRSDMDCSAVADVLKSGRGITKKYKALSAVLFGSAKAPKQIDENHEFNYDLVLKLLCGGKVSLKDLFGKNVYGELDEKSVALNMDDEKLAEIMQSVDDDAELIRVLKSVYDWSVLVDILKGKESVSEAKVAVYEQHREDLAFLKKVIRNHVPERYDEVFRSSSVKNNYASYVGKTNVLGEKKKVGKAKNKEDFCKYISSVVRNVVVQKSDEKRYEDMMERLAVSSFLPKQVDGDNRVIPYQLYWYELNSILENAGLYLPFLGQADEDGITVADKILSVFEFRVPYYVGPLKENPDGNPKLNHWMKRKTEGKIYPWNFTEKVDLDASEEAFISRMTNSCSYLPGEDVLPKNSLCYSAFSVLNEINRIRINGREIPVEVKQGIYTNVFLRYPKVTPKQIRNYLISNNFMKESDLISGIDLTVKSSLKPFFQFRNLMNKGLLSPSEVEEILSRSAYSEDSGRMKKWLRNRFPDLPEEDVRYIAGLKNKDFGRLSKKFLCGIEGTDKQTAEVFTVIRALWETNCNLMQLLSDRFTFTRKIEEISADYYQANPKDLRERLDEMRLSGAVKRPVCRTLDILNDVVKIQGAAPARIFVEMARDSAEEQKGKRTESRLDQLKKLYEKIDTEDVRKLSRKLDEWGDSAHNRLQSDKLFLYFVQLGRCLYTNEIIDLQSVISGDGTYNIEHIYPRSFVKDDSVLNNKILVDSKANGEKGDSYPVAPEIQSKMAGFWTYLHNNGLLTDEKYKRLMRTSRFTDAEKFEFINRQLVETRQSTKVIAALLKELYPESEIVYVKAGLVSDFRHQFGLVKSRQVNDLHHAKDAYLNIAVGNVWYSKFNRRYYNPLADNNIKPEIVFTRVQVCNGKPVWNGAEDKDRISAIVRKNTARMTVYSYSKHSGQSGGLFNQNPVSAGTGLIPLKKGRPTELYGGYDNATVSGFVLVRYLLGKKTEIGLVPLKLLCRDRFLADDGFALQYVLRELGENASGAEILLNKRILKNFAMLSLDGARFCIRGKAGVSEIGLMNMMPFMTSKETEEYIKKLESFENKRKKNDKIVWDERYDGISYARNEELYGYYIEKLSRWPYNKRPGCGTLVDKLEKRRKEFASLDIFLQTEVLLQIQGIFGRMKQADLKALKESSNSGIAKMSLRLSNWKKNYSDVRIIDSSASGLFETQSGNLLDLL